MMDGEDLDRWLDEDRSSEDDRPGAATGWRDDRPRGGAAAEGRRSWPPIAGAAVLLGIIGVSILVAGRDPSPPPSGPAATAAVVDPLAMMGAPAVPVTPTDGTRPSAGDPALSADPTAPGSTEDPMVTGLAAGPVASPLVDGAVPPALAAGSVAALRARLTVPGDVPSYLEWATPVSWRALDAGISLVVLDAVWLEGEDGTLSTARQGRWGVVLGDDAVALAPPWPVAGPPPPAVTDEAPPTGDTRLADVAVALRGAGWSDVIAIAADPHPLLPGIIVALVEGVPPGPLTTTSASSTGGTGGTGNASSTVVWVEDLAADGLRLLGTAS